MGICCEINLFKPSNGFYQPGERVSGLMKYTVKTPTDVKKITMSLKGTGRIVLTKNRGSKHASNYITEESYVDVDNIIQEKQNVIPVGTYEVNLNFDLPESLPSSMYTRKFFNLHYRAECSVEYYLRIKFECSGFLTFNKSFRKEITVVSGVIPRLPREPVIYRETKKVTHLFSSKISNINIKATILKSVLPFEGKIEVNLEVENNSPVVIKSIDTKIIEGHKFKARGYHAVKCENHVVPSADLKASSIQCGDTLNWSVGIDVPSSIFSIENTILTIVSRYYLVRLTVRLPLPHTNAVLDIPVQIGAFDENPGPSGLGRIDESQKDAPPPSYWEAVGEWEKDVKDYSDN